MSSHPGSSTMSLLGALSPLERWTVSGLSPQGWATTLRHQIPQLAPKAPQPVLSCVRTCPRAQAPRSGTVPLLSCVSPTVGCAGGEGERHVLHVCEQARRVCLCVRVSLCLHVCACLSACAHVCVCVHIFT